MPDSATPGTLCDQEPIHVPGSIQPHGVLLVVAVESLAVRYAAGDVDGMLGPGGWADLPLAALLGDELAEAAARIGAGVPGGFAGQVSAASGRRLDVAIHPSGPWLLVELEPACPVSRPAVAMLGELETAVAGFERATSVLGLCDRAASEFRRLTGFDRVMVYRFLDDHAGRVLAEDRRTDLHAFLHHHFPASDIPRQARALYLRNPVRVIPDAGYVPAELRPAWAEATPLDMSDSLLRSVSPVHRLYLANMGVCASASFSIAVDGALWGLVACHHETPRNLPYDVRAAGRSLAAALARQITARDEAESYRQRIRLRSGEDAVVALLSRDGPLETAFASHVDEIRRLFAADGFAALSGGQCLTGGVCPPAAAIRALAEWRIAEGGEPVYATEALSEAMPAALAWREVGSGLLAVTISVEDQWVLLWFRAEQVQQVEWAGNPHKAVTLGAGEELTPRASFAAWREIVRGQARAWTAPELEAARRLRAALLEVRQWRQVRELNRSLTGLLHEKEALLREKEFLIGEVNHRVQNSLQLVGAFLALQGRDAADPVLRGALDEAQRRLHAVALVHRRLYRGDEVRVVDLARYVEELCAETVATMGREWEPCLSLDLAEMTVPTDRAVSLGLVLTELLININKYAYGGGFGPIEIRLVQERGGLRLSVADQGGGKATGHAGFGSRLMEALIGQLGGTLAFEDNQPGLRAVVAVPG